MCNGEGLTTVVVIGQKTVCCSTALHPPRRSMKSHESLLPNVGTDADYVVKELEKRKPRIVRDLL
jgi:hypothetical protein